MTWYRVEGKKFWTTTTNKKNLIPVTMETGDVVYRESNSGIIDKVNTIHEEYWIPEDKMILKHTKNGFFVSDIEVDEEEYYKILDNLGDNIYGIK